VAGVLGANGANVLKPVALDGNIEHGPVPDPLQHMVENHAWDWANRLGGVTQGTALYMAVGRAGLPGAHAQKLVVMAGSTVSDTVITPCLNTEEGDATEPASGHVLAASNIVP